MFKGRRVGVLDVAMAVLRGGAEPVEVRFRRASGPENKRGDRGIGSHPGSSNCSVETKRTFKGAA